MPNIGSLLKEEITRLCRREIRKETGSTKKASSSYRRDIAALKRKVAELERKASHLTKIAERTAKNTTVASVTADRPVRFVAKGLRAHRVRLGLSAPQLAQLLDVSAPSIYGWETKKASPRKEQLSKIIALRSLGKREVQQRLSELRSQRKSQTKRAKR